MQNLIKIEPQVLKIVEMADLYSPKRMVTLKIMSRSPKSNQLLQLFQLCIYASLFKIHPLGKKIAHRTPVLDISKCCYAILVKIHQLVRKIMHGNTILDISKC